jgi:succinyldiaminopimelate transaminase
VRLNPALVEQLRYPFAALEGARARARAAGLVPIDFSIGDPHEATDPAIRRALCESVEERSRYPKSEGLPELREAIAAWCGRRFGVAVDPSTEVMPALGSKEAIFSLHFIALDLAGGRDVVVVTEPGYPIPEQAAQLAGARVLRLPLREANGFLPDLGEIPAATWDRVAVFWVNYPNNPTAALAPLDLYRELAEHATRHGYLLASDEAYSEIYFGDPPASALQVPDRSQVVVFNSQSKRSSMTGYRSGFVIGPPPLVRAYRLWRQLSGVIVPEFVQRATVRALASEDHVERMRDLYRAKRRLFLDLFARRGVRVAGCEATFYLWCEVPGGEPGESFATRLAEHGVIVAPGAMFGPAGEGYFRLALVPTLEECRRAIDILEEIL